MREIAETLLAARKNRKAITQISLERKFSVEEAYSAQRLMKEMELAQGKHLAGYKMGLTSKAKQKDVGVNETIYGYLLSEGKVENTLSVNRLIHPRVEPEIAMRVCRPMKGGRLTKTDIEKAIDWAGPAIEVLDSRYENFKFALPDVIADNTSASGYVLGKANLLETDLRLQGVILKKNGEIIETGAPAAVLNHPFESVLDLTRLLAKSDLGLEPGMIILTGGITASVPVVAGDTIETIWRDETLSIKVVNE